MPTPSDRSAFTLLEILGIVVLLGIVIAVAAPMWVRAREVARGWTCQENLVRIDEAKETWALTADAASGRMVEWDRLVGPDGPLLEQPICPAGGTYTLNPIGIPAQCDYGIPDWLEPRYRHLHPAEGE